MTHNPIICAIDTIDVVRAKQLAASVSPHVGAVKLGLEFFTAHGAAGIRQVSECGTPIFLDLKFHDIPNTVAGAIRAAVAVDCFMMTIHAAGGAEMMKAAVDAANSHKKRPLVVGVTVLTSMDQNDIVSIGVHGEIKDQVKRLADLAQTSGLDGVVCSPHEIAPLRAQCGKDFTLVVPGIRPAGSDSGDQKRVMTPEEAVKLGADYMVIGRPITQAADPQEAARRIAADIAQR